MNLQGNNDKDKIIRKARFVVGYSGKWQLTGTVYEETQGKSKQVLADARVRIRGLRILAQMKRVIIRKKRINLFFRTEVRFFPGLRGYLRPDCCDCRW